MSELINPPSLSTQSPPSEPCQSVEHSTAESPTIATASKPTATVSCAQPAPKLKRFSYTLSWDLLTLKAVATSGAHLALHGQTTTKYEEAAGILIAAAPPRSLQGISEPTWKSLRDRFKKVAADRREKNKKNQAASGIVGERGEREVLLDDLILSMDEQDEEKRAERNEKAEKERRLLEAGERIWDQALLRGSVEEEGSVVEGDGSGSPPQSGTPSTRRTKLRIQYESDGQEKELMMNELQQRREIDSKRLKLEEERFIVEKQCDQRQVAEAEKRIVLEERKVVLEEKKAELEIEERKQALQERKGLVDLLAALANKLN